MMDRWTDGYSGGWGIQTMIQTMTEPQKGQTNVQQTDGYSGGVASGLLQNPDCDKTKSKICLHSSNYGYKGLAMALMHPTH